jgi:hypothetical protein
MELRDLIQRINDDAYHVPADVVAEAIVSNPLALLTFVVAQNP